ncbi:MAG: Y-family DNA polymerase, partial [Beijerinckiaceae bacterium]
VDAAALKLGLGPGMTLADARAREADCVVAEYDSNTDARVLIALAASCERFTPLVALDAPHGLTLDITGCAHLFDGEERLLESARASLLKAGFSSRAAIASTPDAARAFARFAATPLTISDDDEKIARTLPLAALELSHDTALALKRAGLNTLADLADRPSTAFSSRFDEDIAVRLRRILGHEDRRITPLRSLPDCMAEKHFAEPVTHHDALMQTLHLLITDITDILEKRGAGGRIFEAYFFRSDGAVRRITVETSKPSRDIQSLLRLFRERIDALADPLDPGFGFDAMRLCVPVINELAQAQISLDQRTQDDVALTELIDRLIARFGREHVLRFAARDTHDPSRAARWISASDESATIPWDKPETGEPPQRPLHLFAHPQPIETLAEVPDGPPLRFRWRRVQHDVARAEGPERIAPEWWRNAEGETRDYYRIEDAQGHRFWIFREGFYGQREGGPRWFVHGLFA